MERGEITSWSTPSIHETKARTELIANGGHYIRGYDPVTDSHIYAIGKRKAAAKSGS